MRRSVWSRAIVAALAVAWIASLPVAETAAERTQSSSEATVAPKNALRIGVASFERRASGGMEVPDVAQLLADRVAADPRAEVVGPATLGAGPATPAQPEAVRTWAGPQGLDAVVLGQVTQLGRSTSVDVRLWSGMTGQALGTYVEEAAGPGALPEAIDRLATRLVDAVAEPAVAAQPPVASPPPTGVAESATESKPKALSRTGLDSSKPLAIYANELEAIEGPKGERTINFQGGVRVEQEDVELRSNALKAFYPAGSSQPQHLTATGNVRVRQGERHMSCDRADFEQKDQRLICTGDAELREGEDRVRGKQIEIFFDSSRILVKGGARLNINQEGS